MRPLGQRSLDLLDRFGLREPLHGGDFTREPVESGLVELTLGIRLFRLRLRPEEVADNFRDGDDVAGIDLGLVFLRPARPHGPLDAQEYEAKINSGDIVAIAEVVRDLYRSESQPEQSYSERQLYEAALDRLSREVAAVQRLTETEAVKEIEAALAKGPHRGPKPEVEDDAVVEEEAA